MKKLLIIVVLLTLSANVFADVFADNWFNGGTLHQANFILWENSSYENKLATCGDWLSVTTWKGKLKTYSDFDLLKIQADILVKALDSCIAEGKGLGLTVVEVAVMFIQQSYDLRP